MSTHIMVDLETLGTRPGCRILSIGAVVFSSDGLGNEFYTELRINDQGLLVVEPATWAWWEQQAPEVRDRLFANQDKKSGLLTALLDFSEWLVKQNYGQELFIWGNGSDFDNAILQVAYTATNMEPPWKFWNNRCYRTLKNLVPQLKMVRQGAHHNALDDAKSQADHAVNLLHHLKVWP